MDELTTPTQSAGSTSQNPIQPLVDEPLVATETPAPATTTTTTEQAPVTPAAVEPQTTTPMQSASSTSPTPITETQATAEPATQNSFIQMIMENKKIVIIGIVAVVAIVIGLSVFIGAKSSNEYQGLIQRIDTETKDLNKSSQTNISAPSEIDNSVPFEMEGASSGKVAR